MEENTEKKRLYVYNIIEQSPKQDQAELKSKSLITSFMFQVRNLENANPSMGNESDFVPGKDEQKNFAKVLVYLDALPNVLSVQVDDSRRPIDQGPVDSLDFHRMEFSKPSKDGKWEFIEGYDYATYINEVQFVPGARGGKRYGPKGRTTLIVVYSSS